MKNSITLTGAQASLRWGYHAAAELGAWSMVADAGGGTVTAKVVTHDAFRVSQHPLTFVVPRPSGSWTWPVVETLQISGSSVSVRVGPPQE